MITAKTALTFDRVLSFANRVDDMPPPTEEEQPVLFYLDATVESGIYSAFDGSVFDMKIPAKFASPRVVHALRRLYESGGWSVGVFEQFAADGALDAHQLVFAASSHGEAAAAEVPPHTSAARSLLTAVTGAAKPKRAVPEKPRVALVSDVPGWAFDQNMRDLALYLREKFEFDFVYTENWFKGERPPWENFDVIYEAYHRNPPMGIPLSRAVGALRSQWFRPEKKEPPTAEDIALVNGYKAFQVAAKRNYDELAATCPNVVYLTNPVDTNRFTQTPPRDTIVASWNGNAGHKSPDGKFIKHFYDIVVPSCSRAGVQMVAAEFNTKEGPMRRRTSAEMPEFYQQSNVALCASDYEAASNSVMEAMSSGLALIVTDCGNHREMRDSQVAAYGDSGILLVPGEVGAFSSALRELTPQRAQQMGEINRREIVERWSWEKWAPAYEAFLRKAL